MKKHVWIWIAVLLVLTGSEAIFANPAEEMDGARYGTGLLPLVGREISLDGEPPCRAASYGGQREPSEWDRFASNYYYNQMNGRQQEFYDQLDEEAYAYLSTWETVNGYGSGTSNLIAAAGLSETEAKEVYQIFRYANPQYYFISNRYFVGREGGTMYFAFDVYPAFVNGRERAHATKEFKSSVEGALEEVLAAGEEPEARARAAHDWVARKVDYDQNYMDESIDFSEYEMTAYTQSAYSTFCRDVTVCAGYTLAYELLCNAAGIDSVSVTSETHAWNKVRLYGNWYQVDCTWDDLGILGAEVDVFYDFFDRSDAYFLENDQEDAHVAEAYLADYNSPACLYDSVLEDDEEMYRRLPGVIPQEYKLTEKAAPPSFGDAARNGTEFTLTLSCGTEGEPVYYYTLDGTDPAVSASKCGRCSDGTLVFNGEREVRVIAVVDGYLESEPSVYKSVLPLYTVTFQSGGGTPVAGQQRKEGEPAGMPVRPSRTGYVFGGWYKDAAHTQPWNFLTDCVSGNLTLYAKWTPEEYRITYVTGGGTIASSALSSYTIQSPAIVLKNPTKKGYLFDGWYKDALYRTKITVIGSGSAGNLNLYAKWTKVAKPKRAALSKIRNKKGRKIEVKIKKISDAAGYQIRYSKKANMKSAKKTTATSTAKTISKLSAGKRYYIQVRAYKKDSAGKNVYGDWSKKRSVTVRK